MPGGPSRRPGRAPCEEGGDVEGVAAVAVAAGGREPIGAQLFGNPAARGQGVLQPLREGHETLAAVDDLPIGPATPGQAVVEQQMGEGLTTQGDRNPFHPGEIAEADLAGLIGQREHHLRRRAMQGLPRLHPTLQGAFERTPVLIRPLLLQVLQQRFSDLGQWVGSPPATGLGGFGLEAA